MDQESRKKLHNLLVSEQLYSKPYNEFESQFSNPASQKKLYGLLTSEGLYSKSESDFNNQFFADVNTTQKKNPNQNQQLGKEVTASPSTSGVTQSSSVSQSQKPSAAPATPVKPKAPVKPVTSVGQQSQGRLLMVPQSKAKTPGEAALERSKNFRDVTNPNWNPAQKKQDINTLTKNTMERASYLATDIKKFNSDAATLEKDIANFTALAESNPNNPQLITLQKQLQQRTADIQSRSDALQKNSKEIEGAQVEIKRQAIENYNQKAKQGSFGGFVWNKFVEGVSDISAGLDEAIAMYDIIPAATLDIFGIDNDIYKEKPWLKNAPVDLYRKERKKKLLEMHQPTIESWKTQGTTPEYMQQLEKDSDWAAAIGGVMSSVPAMATGVWGMGLQSYGSFYKQVESDPYLKTLPKQDLDFVALPLALGTAWLENTGLSAMLGKGSKPASSYVVKTLTKVLGKVPKNAPLELVKKKFQDVVIKEVKKYGVQILESKIGQGVTKVAKTKAGKFATRLGGAGLVEAETEASQGALEDELKRLYNEVNNNEAFKVANFASQEYIDKRSQEAKLGFMGSLILGAPIQIAQSVAGGKQVTDDDYVAMRDMIMDPEQLKLMQAQVAVDLVGEKITKEQALAKLKDIDDTRKILKKIPENLSVESQRKAYAILAKNAKLQQEIDNTAKGIEGKDPNLVTGYVEYMNKKQAEIDANNEELSKLPQLSIKEKAEFVIPEPDESGRINFEFSSESEIPNELKALTPQGSGSGTDLNGNKKIFLSFSKEQIDPIRDALQKQATSQVPVQPEAGTGLQVAEGEPQAKPQVPTQEGQGQEVKEEDVILSGLSNGFKAGTPNSFDPRSDEGIMENVQRNKSFATTATIDGKKYVVVGLRLNQDIGAKTSGRDGYTFAMIEDNGNLPNNVVDVLTQKAIANTSSIYPNITDATIDSFKPIEVNQELVQPIAQPVQPVTSEKQQPKATETTTPTEQPKATTIQDSIDADNTFTMRGKEGNLFVDDNGQVLFESGDEIVELGNISDIAETGLSDFGLEPKAPVAIEIGDDGSIMVSGKKYVNVEQAPMDAITFDEDGNVKAVRLETENGQSRYFRGKRAESIAYQYTLQNFENNATDEQIDNALNQATEAATTQESTGEVTNETEDAVVDEGAKQENLDLDNVSETSGVKAKNLRQLIRINKKLFGLSWTKATMSAIAMDRMIGAMAKREGISKEEMYKRIEFRTKSPAVAEQQVVTPQATAEVTAVEETGKKRKPRAPKPAFENVEITENIEPTTPEEQAYVEEQSSQPIFWTKVPKRKGDPKIAARNKVIMQGAQDLLDGKITNEQYQEILQQESPIVPIEQFFDPATQEEVTGALSKDKVGLVDSPTEKGTVFTDSKGEEFEVTSDEVGLRLDIPAFINNNTWVVTVHGDVTNKKTGKKTKDKAISYGNVARITGVKFDFSPTQAIAVATKKQDKVPFLKMRGKMAPIEGATMNERAENAKKMIEQIKNDPAWTQIGSNPFKHSGFFNRATGQPILGADEVIQIGGLVYAKNVQETTWDNPIFEVKGERGKAKPTDAAGKNVLFQGNRAAVEIASDGTAIIYAMTDPNVSSPVHELAHVFQHYLTEAEWNAVTKWAKSDKWSVETSEKFARGFEKYLSEGKAPTKELQAVFDKFKQWLTDIYNGITGSEIDLKLNTEMRKIYAQMFNEKVTKPKEAPSAQKILGAKPKMVTVNEMSSLKGQLRLQAKAAKTAYEFAEAARKLVATYIKNNVQGALSPADQKAIFRAMEGKLDTPENKKKMIDKITGILQASEGKIAIKELDALGRMLKSMEKGSKLGAKAVKDQIKTVVATIKSMGVKNQLKPAQVRLLLNGMAKNLMNATVREKFLASAQRVLNNAAYADQVLQSQKLKAKIRKTLKRGKEIVDVEQSVRNFLKLDPKMVEDLDEYMDYATEIFDAIRNVQVKDGKALGKRAAVLANINAYTAEQNKIQDEINKNMLLDEYQYLVDAGLISGDMSFDEINSYINSVENNPNSAESTKSEIVREYAKQAFAGFAQSAKELLEEGEYDEQDIDFDMINEFINMDIETLPIDKQLAAVESLENFVVNGVTSRMGAILQTYIGQNNATKNAESGMKARPLSYGLFGRLSYLKRITTKGLLGKLLGGIAIAGDLYNNLEAVYISKSESLISGLFRSTDTAIKFLKYSGFSKIVRGFVEGKKIVNDFAKKYSDKFEKSKPNGKAFNDASNVFERGIFADLSRTIKDGTPEQIQAEFDRRMKQLRLTIETLKGTGKQSLIDKANLYDEIYQKVKNAKNIEEVAQNVDPINQAAVKEIQDMWKKYYPEFKKMAADYYNIELDEDVNYSPDMYEKLAEDLSDDLITKGAFKMAFDVISTEEVGTLKKNQKIDGLPKNKDSQEINRVRDYDYDFNNINALEKTLIDVRTTPFVQQFEGYTNSAAFKEIFPDFDDRQMVKKRLNFNINSLRERQDTYSADTAKMVNRIVTSLSKYGTRIGLGALAAAPKQSIPMVGNTMINLIDDLGSFGMGIADFWDKDAMDFLENSGYGISLRGAESQTSIDFAEKLIERANQGKVGNIQQALSYLGDKYIEKFLKNPDVTVANMAWLAYYRNKLKSMGYDMNNFDWKTHELNEDAADYAEFMVQDQQNMNISELGGKLLASKDATTKTIRQLLFPFASYQFNLKDKNNRNITILTSKTSTIEEKAKATKSLAAGLVESYMFQTIQGLIGVMLLKAAYAAIGYEEPEEEKTNGIWDAIKKAMPFARTTSPSEQFNDSIFVGKSIFEFVAPIPPNLEYLTMLGLNNLLDTIQGGTPEEQLKKKKQEEKEAETSITGRAIKKKRKLAFGEVPEDKEAKKKEQKIKDRMEQPFRFFAKEEIPYMQAIGDIVGGVPAVGIESLYDFVSRAKEANNGSFKDKYGEYAYSDEQKKILGLSLIPRALVTFNIAPREFLTISNNIVKAVNRKAKDDTKAQKEEDKKKNNFRF